jgi:prepilin-type N-terminal cleavage/methylation domain-containing protein
MRGLQTGATRRSTAAGFTLLEVIVVITVLVLTGVLVAPALLPPRQDDQDAELVRLVRTARMAAARRGETLVLQLSLAGEWTMEGERATDPRDAVAGTLAGYSGPGWTLVVSPIGTCGFDVRSTAAAAAVPLDPMTCELVAP